MSERHIDAEGERRLIEAGFLPEESHVGKRRWKDPDTGHTMPGGAALDRVERREEQELKEAGWERVEVGGETYWCKPDSGHLYPRGPAYDTQAQEPGVRAKSIRRREPCTQVEFCTAAVLTRYTKTSENPFEREDNARANKRFNV